MLLSTRPRHVFTARWMSRAASKPAGWSCGRR